jgi:hypothetical protein
MPLPVITDVFRVTLNWSSTDLPTTHNVLHFYCPGGDVTQLDTALQANRTQAMFPMICSNYGMLNYDVIKLDGTSPTFVIPFTDPIFGPNAGACVPAVAGVISFKTLLRGPSGRGRSYLGPVAETVMQDGTGQWDVPTMKTAWETFAGTLNGLTPPIIHVVASYLNADQRQVVVYEPKLKLGTQRRRQEAVQTAG